MIRTIKGRITFWAVLVLMISIAAVTFANIFTLGGRLRREQENAIQAETERYAEEVNSRIQRIVGMLDGVSSAIVANGTVEEAEARRIIDTFYEDNSELLNVYIGTENGQFYQANEAPMPEGYDPRKRPWYVEAKESGETTVINPYIDTTTGGMVASVSKPFILDGQVAGVVAIDIEVDVLVEIVESVQFENEAYGFLIDSDRNIISHKNKLFNPTTEGLTNVSEVMDELEVVVKNAGNGVMKLYDFNGIESYFACVEIETGGWIFGMAMPTEHIESQIVHSIGVSMVIGITAVLLSLVACLYMIKKELLPIEKMKIAVDRIANGDFSESLDFAKKDDELGELQNEMSQLVELLNEIISREKFILGEISQGNLMVDDMNTLPGEFNDIAESVNMIKAQLNNLITEIQFAAINLQGTAMGFTGSADPEEMRAVFNALSMEANELMEKANAFKTGI